MAGQPPDNGGVGYLRERTLTSCTIHIDGIDRSRPWGIWPSVALIQLALGAFKKRCGRVSNTTVSLFIIKRTWERQLAGVNCRGRRERGLHVGGSIERPHTQKYRSSPKKHSDPPHHRVQMKLSQAGSSEGGDSDWSWQNRSRLVSLARSSLDWSSLENPRRNNRGRHCRIGWLIVDPWGGWVVEIRV